MPLDVIIDDNQDYSQGSNNYSIQDWSFTPQIPIEVVHLLGSPYPNDINVSVQIKDYLQIFGSQYSQYSIKTSTSTSTYITLSGNIPDATGDGYVLNATNLDTVITIGYQAFEVATPGTSFIPFTLIVYGKDSFGNLIQIEEIPFTVKLTFANYDDEVFVPENFLLHHISGSTNYLSTVFKVYSNGSYQLKLPDFYTLTGPGVNSSTTGGGKLIVLGVGTNEYVLSLNNNVNLKDTGTYNDILTVTSNGSAQYLNALRLVISENGLVQFTPSSLEFFSIKNIQECQPLNFSIICSGDFTVNFPNFLNNLDFSSSNSYNGTVSGVFSGNLSPGIYLGNIVITYLNEDYFVPVKYTVAEAVILGPSIDGINFTEDYNQISSFYGENYYRILLDYKIKLFQYSFAFPEESTLNYKLSLFKNRVDEFIGKRIGSVMFELEDLASVNLESLNNIFLQDNLFFVRELYRPVSLDLYIDFLDTTSDVIVESFNYQNLMFLAGRKPIKAFSHTALLSYFTFPIRVTTNTQQLISFYKQTSHIIRVYKNGAFEIEYNHSVQNASTFVFKKDFNNYQPGDDVEIRLYKNIPFDAVLEFWYEDVENYISQKFLVFHEGKSSNIIAWVNESRTLSSFEFTGSMTFETQKNSSSFKVYKNFKEIIKKGKIKKGQIIKINTGPILKENALLIDELSDADIAWLYIDNFERSISLVPIVSNQIISDTDLDIYEYEVEFEINFNNDYEIYQ